MYSSFTKKNEDVQEQSFNLFCYDIFLMLDDLDDGFLTFDEIKDALPILMKCSMQNLTVDDLREEWNKVSGGEN